MQRFLLPFVDFNVVWKFRSSQNHVCCLRSVKFIGLAMGIAGTAPWPRLWRSFTHDVILKRRKSAFTTCSKLFIALENWHRPKESKCRRLLLLLNLLFTLCSLPNVYKISPRYINFKKHRCCPLYTMVTWPGHITGLFYRPMLCSLLFALYQTFIKSVPGI